MLSDRDFALATIRYDEKVMRVDEHLKALDEASHAFAKEHGQIAALAEVNAQETKLLLKVDEDFEVPVKWGVIIGDAVHCLRSALDQLATTLWTDKPTVAACFPICRTEKQWIIEAPRMIWSVPKEYVAAINRAQPYHRGDRAHSHPFAVLNALWNMDKHRAIPSVGLNASQISAEVESQGVKIGEFRTKPGVTFKKGAVIAEAKIARDGSGLDPKVNVNPRLAVRIGFGLIDDTPSISGKPVIETFHEFLVPALLNVLKDVKAVQDGQPFSTEW